MTYSPKGVIYDHKRHAVKLGNKESRGVVVNYDRNTFIVEAAKLE